LYLESQKLLSTFRFDFIVRRNTTAATHAAARGCG
jgi:hypothetical protein